LLRSACPHLLAGRSLKTREDPSLQVHPPQCGNTRPCILCKGGDYDFPPQPPPLHNSVYPCESAKSMAQKLSVVLRCRRISRAPRAPITMAAPPKNEALPVLFFSHRSRMEELRAHLRCACTLGHPRPLDTFTYTTRTYHENREAHTQSCGP
jgi:hypothetical protein